MAANEPKLYLIDADVLLHIRLRLDSKHIYDEIGKLARRGVAKSITQVMDEVERFSDVTTALASHRTALCLSNQVQFHAAVGEAMELVGLHAGYLWEQTGGKNPDPADPWLVAIGKALSYTVVTDENPRKQHRIPAACRHPAIQAKCISGPHFLIETGIVTDVRPEHIDPDRFFGVHKVEEPSR